MVPRLDTKACLVHTNIWSWPDTRKAEAAHSRMNAGTVPIVNNGVLTMSTMWRNRHLILSVIVWKFYKLQKYTGYRILQNQETVQYSENTSAYWYDNCYSVKWFSNETISFIGLCDTLLTLAR